MARAPLVLFLDADDQLAPGALAAMCQAYSESGGRYIYGDWQPMGASEPVREAEYDTAAWVDFDDLSGKHAVTVLMATADARALRFDEGLPAWEDWDFFARAAVAGYQGRRVEAVALYVRKLAGSRTEIARARASGIIETLRERYGGAEMAGCCGGNGAAALAAKQAWAGVPAERLGGITAQVTTKSVPAQTDPNVVQPVRMEFIGSRTGAVTYPGLRGSGRAYRGGNNPVNKFHNVHPADVSTLEAGGDWRRVAPVIAAVMPVPAATPVASAPPPELAQHVLDNPTEAAALGPVITVSGPASDVQVNNNSTDEPLEHFIQTADGPVRRRVSRPKGGKNTPLRDDLPPLDA